MDDLAGWMNGWLNENIFTWKNRRDWTKNNINFVINVKLIYSVRPMGVQKCSKSGRKWIISMQLYVSFIFYAISYMAYV